MDRPSTEDSSAKSQGAGGHKSKHSPDYLNYFGQDREFHLWFADKRTKLLSLVFPPFVKIGLAPDTISYVGISLLVGVILYFVRKPEVAVFFLAGHVILDGLDGSFARHTGKASQSGAFTDLVCDQLGMVVVAMLAIFHHMAPPLIGAVYITLYLIVVVFGVIINVMGLGTRITITSKYFLYIVYLIWAVWRVNLFTPFMSLLSAIMAIEVVIGYYRLKRGIRKKFDTEVKFTTGDQYSGRLNYVLNVSVPIIVLLSILIWGNWIPINSMLDRPGLKPQWTESFQKITLDEDREILGAAADSKGLMVLVRYPDQRLEIRRLDHNSQSSDFFAIPEYVTPAFDTFPVDGNMLLMVDHTTRLLMGFDLETSFKTQKAVIVLTLPLAYLRITGMAVATLDNKRVWLAANYLYTRKTYVVDPEKALKKGNIPGGVIASYVNAGFPAGVAVHDNIVFEFNKSPLHSLIYAAPLSKLTRRMILINTDKSFSPPSRDTMGPIVMDDSLVMLDKTGNIFTCNLQELLKTK
jgi:phosphatidylglycerophosphate synthase